MIKRVNERENQGDQDRVSVFVCELERDRERKGQAAATTERNFQIRNYLGWRKHAHGQRQTTTAT